MKQELVFYFLLDSQQEFLSLSHSSIKYLDFYSFLLSPSRLSGHPRCAIPMASCSNDHFNPDLALSHVVILDHKVVKIKSSLGSLALSWSRQGDGELN